MLLAVRHFLWPKASFTRSFFTARATFMAFSTSRIWILTYITIYYIFIPSILLFRFLSWLNIFFIIFILFRKGAHIVSVHLLLTTQIVALRCFQGTSLRNIISFNTCHVTFTISIYIQIFHLITFAVLPWCSLLRCLGLYSTIWLM